jgi:hypothetical protein
MKTFLNNLSNKMKKSKVWRFLVGNPVKELPDKFTQMHNDYLKKEKALNTIEIPKKKSSIHKKKPVINPELIDRVTELKETKPPFSTQLLLPFSVIDEIQIQETTKDYK